MGEDGNCDECSGLLHSHCFSYAYSCLCCSHLQTDMSNFHPHEGILYVRIQHLVSQKWALSLDISKALTRLGASSKWSAANGLAGNARDGKWVPAQVAPQCVPSAHKNACVSAMATVAAALQLQWDPRTDPACIGKQLRLAGMFFGKHQFGNGSGSGSDSCPRYRATILTLPPSHPHS